MNKVILIGHVGSDIDTHTFGNGNKKVSFSLATNKKWNDKDGKRQEKTTWHNIEAFGKITDVIEKWVSKGNKLMVEGEIDVQSWDKDGETKYKTVIMLQNMEMLGSNDASNKQTPSKGSTPPSQPSSSITDDEINDLPFLS